MTLAILALVVGVVVLAWSADQFVIGAARVALVRQVPTLVVGVVIVGFGTSAPELLVSALAAGRDEPEIAVGNVVGSNVANLSLLLGVGAIIVPLAVASRTVRREAPIVVAAVVLFGVVVQGSGITRIEGVVLLGAMVPALVFVTRRSTDDPLAAETEELIDPVGSNLFNALAVGGVVGLVGGTGLDDTRLTTVAVGATVLVAVGALVVMATSHTVVRREGIGLLLVYATLLPMPA